MEQEDLDKRPCVVMSDIEGNQPFHVAGQEHAIRYAQSRAAENRGSTWTVYVGTHTFCLKPKAKEADKKAEA